MGFCRINNIKALFIWDFFQRDVGFYDLVILVNDDGTPKLQNQKFLKVCLFIYITYTITVQMMSSIIKKIKN